VCETVKGLQILWTKLKGVKTDGAPSKMGKKTGVIGRIRREMDKHPKFLHGTPVLLPPIVSLWKNVEV
jgi:hypothetical protein